MPRLRPRRENYSVPNKPTEAICIESFRPAPISAYIERGQRLPLDHHAVIAHPRFFMGVVPLEEVTNHDAA
jgi:hypothetical protein